MILSGEKRWRQCVQLDTICVQKQGEGDMHICSQMHKVILKGCGGIGSCDCVQGGKWKSGEGERCLTVYRVSFGY